MTILKITVEDEQAVLIKRLLSDMKAVINIEEEPSQIPDEVPDEIKNSYTRIKAILEEAKGKALFKEIEDPSAWQREIRKEWDRDF